ncbi:MAG: hypothetical protein U0V48_13720 [Anaerolineales bacterium]
MLALNIVNRNFAELFQPLEYDQGAPLIFIVEKFFNMLFGRQELVLRSFPLLAGLASLVLFICSVEKHCKARACFSLSHCSLSIPNWIYYTSEAKQYIVDAVVGVGLLLLAIPIFQNQSSKKNFSLLAVAGISRAVVLASRLVRPRRGICVSRARHPIFANARLQ